MQAQDNQGVIGQYLYITTFARVYIIYINKLPIAKGLLSHFRNSIILESIVVTSLDKGLVVRLHVTVL